MKGLSEIANTLYYGHCLIGIFIMIFMAVITGGFSYLEHVPLFWDGTSEIGSHYSVFKTRTINYYAMLLIMIGIYLIIIVAGAKFLDTGLAESSLITLRKLGAYLLIFSICTMPYYSFIIPTIQILFVKMGLTIAYWLSLVLKISQSMGIGNEGSGF